MRFVIWLALLSQVHCRNTRTLSTEIPLRRVVNQDKTKLQAVLRINEVTVLADVVFDSDKIQIEQTLVTDIEALYVPDQNAYLAVFEWHEMRTLNYFTTGPRSVLGLGPGSDLFHHFKAIEVCTQQRSIFLLLDRLQTRCQDINAYVAIERICDTNCTYVFETPDGGSIFIDDFDMLSTAVYLRDEDVGHKFISLYSGQLVPASSISNLAQSSHGVCGLNVLDPPLALLLEPTQMHVVKSLDTSLAGPVNFSFWFLILVLFYKWWLGRPWSKTDEFWTFALENLGSMILFPCIFWLVIHSPNYELRTDMFFYPLNDDGLSFTTVVTGTEIIGVYLLPAIRLLLYLLSHQYGLSRHLYIARRSTYLLQIGLPCVFAFMTAVTDKMQVFICWLIWNLLLFLLSYSICALGFYHTTYRIPRFCAAVNGLMAILFAILLVFMVIIGIYGICYEFMARIAGQTFVSETRITFNIVNAIGVGVMAASYYVSRNQLVLDTVNQTKKD